MKQTPPANYPLLLTGVQRLNAIARQTTILCLMLLLTPTAWPQTKSEQTEKEIEKIQVTANKRQAYLQETSMAVSVLTAQDIENSGARHFSDWFTSIPGLYSTDHGPSDKRYIIRGIIASGEPQVALYYDEIPVSGAGFNGEDSNAGAQQSDLTLWDIDRIEVLRGPQGTLYGQGAMSGVIKILYRQPELQVYEAALALHAETTRDGDASHGLKGMVNIPLGQDSLALRLSGYYSDTGGYIDDVVYGRQEINDDQTRGGRAALLWSLSPRSQVSVSTFFQEVETGAAFDYHLQTFGSDHYRQQNFVQTPLTDTLKMLNLSYRYDTDSLGAIASFSYIDREFLRLFDTSRFVFSMLGCELDDFPDCLAGTASWGRETVYSQAAELRFFSQGTGAFNWLGGLYYQQRDNSRLGQVAFTNSSGQMEFDNQGVALNRLFARDNQGTTRGKAVFGEVSYAFTPRWQATAGLRWYQSEKEDRQETLASIFGPPGKFIAQKVKDDSWVGKVNLSYQWHKNTLLYGQISEGFRPGGVNQPLGFADNAPAYKADSLINYELGWKLNFNHNRARFYGAVYQMDWDDIQTQATDETTGAFTFITNAGKARATGLELELKTSLGENTEIYSGINLLDARLTQDQPGAGQLASAGFDGDQLPHSPKWSVAISADYHLDHGLGQDNLIRVDFRQVGDMVTAFPGDPGYLKLNGYSSTTLRYHFSLQQWRLALYISNLFDHREATSAALSDQAIVASPLRPRTLGLSVYYDFGL
ncbi:TonB-dependent receptor [Thalassomonas sp. RHCl1]|uniref:TonB-dependent receptor n=1 Tax=Thalassomonas sp. RHCl1 TaxID=2995320 RepID=UPI00248BC57D|nr:TonB-dependent receptor [Thalassomonas sp. RHCl1]